MTRKEKIEILNNIQDCKGLASELLPPINIYLLEMEPGVFMDSDRGYRSIKKEDTDSYIQSLKNLHKPNVVNVNYVSYQECKRMQDELEEMC